MAFSNQPQGKRGMVITLGWFAGANAFQAGGTPTVGATTFVIPHRVGDWTASNPKPTIADPLDQGQKNLAAAPVLVDAQEAAGGFSVNYTHETDPAILALMDILYGDGTAAALPSVITGSEEVYCDMKVEWIHPGLPAEDHGRVYGQVRLTHDETMGDTMTESVSWTSRELEYTRF